MNTTETIHAAIGAAMLAGIFYLVLWRIRAAMVDLFRQEMFELRDDLFDFAAANNIAFNHSAYLLLRDTINAYIRYGHDLCLWNMTFMFLSAKTMQRNETSYADVLQREMRKLPRQTEAHMIEFRNRMNQNVAVHLLRGSPEVLITIIAPALIVISGIIGGGAMLKKVVSWLCPQMNRLDSAVYHNNAACPA